MKAIVALLLFFVTYGAFCKKPHPQKPPPPTCNPGAPRTCMFQVPNDYCGWRTKDVKFSSCGSSTCVEITKKKGHLKSELACSTNGRTHCLTFQYNFQNEDLVSELEIEIKTSADEEIEKELQQTDTGKWHRHWQNVTTNSHFRVTIKLEDESGSDHRVWIRDFVYTKSPCGSITTTAPITTQSSTTTTPTTTTKSTTSPSTTPTSPHVSTPGASNASTEASKSKDKSSSSNTGGIVAAVIIILLLFIVAIFVVIVILFRRGKLQFLKDITCFTFSAGLLDSCFGFIPGRFNCCKPSDQPKPDTEEASDAARAGYNGLTRSMIGQPQDLQDSTHPTEDYYSAIKDGDQPARITGNKNGVQLQAAPGNVAHTGEGEYSVIRDSSIGVSESVGIYHTPQEDPTGPTGIYHDGPAPTQAGVYHILDPEADASASGEGRSVYHLPSPVPTRAAVSSTPNNDDYNALDFEGKETSKKKAESGEGNTYSHLNDGDGDAYNEMKRGRKREVIDGDYSHIH